MVHGFFECQTTGTVFLRWAQEVQTASDLTLKAGSWLVAREIGDAP